MTVDNPIRSLAIRIVVNPWFDRVSLLVIILSSIAMAIVDPNDFDDSGPRNSLVAQADWFFDVVFTLEMVVKVIANGLVLHKESYMRDPWNRFDLFVVVSAWLSKAPGLSKARLSFFRTFRVLRPLKTIRGIKGMQVVVQSLLVSIPLLLDVMALLTFSLFVFGVLGVQLWSGSMRQQCYSATDLTTLADPSGYDRCSMWSLGRKCPEGFVCLKGQNPNFGFTNFDNVPAAFLLIFGIVTLEGWTDSMTWLSQCSTRWTSFYFVFFVFFGSFFAMQLTLAVIYGKYEFISNQMEEKQKAEAAKAKAASELLKASRARIATVAQGGGGTGSGPSTPSLGSGKTSPRVSPRLAALQLPPPQQQRQSLWTRCVRRAQSLLTLSTRFPRLVSLVTTARRKTARIVEHRYTSWLVMAVILANTVFLAMDHHGISESWNHALDVGNLVFTVFFVLECLLKVVAYGIVGYFRLKVNTFDFVVVLSSVVELAVGGAGIISVLRALRLLRVFKLIRASPSLRRVSDIVMMTLPSVGHSSLVLVLFLFIFSVLGMQIFGGKLRKLGTPPDYADGPRTYFDTFGWSAVVVFQIITGENWNVVCNDAMRATHWTAVFYFISCVAIGNYVLLNLFQAILLSKFSSSRAELRQQEQRSRIAATLAGSKMARVMKLEAEAKSRRSAVASGALGRSASLSNARTVSIHQQQQQQQQQQPGSGESSGAASPALSPQLGANAAESSAAGMLMSESSAHRVAALKGGSLPTRRRANFFADTIASNKEAAEREGLPPLVGASGPGAEGEGLDRRASPTTLVLPLPPLNLTGAASAPQPGLGGLSATASEPTPRPSAAGGRGSRHGESLASVTSSVSNEDEDAEQQGGKKKLTYIQRMRLEEAANRVFFESEKPPELRGVVCLCLTPSSTLRQEVHHFISHPYFEYMVVLMILASSLALALETPWTDRTRGLGRILALADYFFTTVFALEMVLKIFVLGLVHHKGSYLRNPWNVLDCLVVLVSIATLALAEVNLKFLRALRALRPLRIVSRNDSMKVVVNSIVRAIPSLLSVLAICLLFFLIFGILGVQLFKGKMGTCNDPSMLTIEECVGWFMDPRSPAGAGPVPRSWGSLPANFDNIFQAILVLFELATLEGWPVTMYQGIDAVAYGVAPRRDHNPLVAAYFVVFVIFGALFLVNLFVGVVVDEFNQMSEIQNGSAFLTDTQRQWVNAQKLMQRHAPKRVIHPPDPSKHPYRSALYRLTTNPKFEWFIMLCIGANIAIMSAGHFEQPVLVDDLLFYANIAFTIVFLLEAVLKIAALTFRVYIEDPWNKFDLLVVLLSIPSVFVDVGVGATIFRVFRLIRMFKLIRTANGIRVLLQTLFYSLPTMWNVGSLLVLVFFVFSVAGVALFGKVRPNGNLTADRNFSNFVNGLITLFGCSTGENWNGIMHDCSVQPPYCSEELGDCGSVWFAAPFFVTFISLVTFILLNLMVAVLLENFSDLTADTDSLALTRAHIAGFVAAWSKFDPKATHFIPASKLYLLLLELGLPLGLPAGSTRSAAVVLARTLDIPDYSGSLHFRDVMLVLANRRFGVTEVPLCEARARVAKEWEKNFKTLKFIRNYKVRATVQDHYAAMQVQALWRGHLSRKAARLTKMMRKHEERVNTASRIYCHLTELFELADERGKMLAEESARQQRLQGKLRAGGDDDNYHGGGGAATGGSPSLARNPMPALPRILPPLLLAPPPPSAAGLPLADRRGSNSNLSSQHGSSGNISSHDGSTGNQEASESGSADGRGAEGGGSGLTPPRFGAAFLGSPRQSTGGQPHLPPLARRRSITPMAAPLVIVSRSAGSDLKFGGTSNPTAMDKLLSTDASNPLAQEIFKQRAAAKEDNDW